MTTPTPKFYHGIWFVGNATGDWMGSVYKEDGKWMLEYRFRYYYPNDPGNDAFSVQDKKNWYKFGTKDDSEEDRAKMVQAIEMIMPVMALKYGNKVDFVDLDCDQSSPKFFFELASRPWAHVKQVSEEEAEAMGVV